MNTPAEPSSTHAPEVEAPHSLEAIAKTVDARISELISDEIARWSAVCADLGQPLEDLLAFALAGGKRLRPAFCHWAYVAAGGDGGDQVIVDASAAIELLHCFALIHDDVMDGSELRRGRRSVHVRYSDLHQQSAWLGESRRFGDGAAVLIGDLAFVYSDMLLESTSIEARRVFSELRLEVNFGQYLDVMGTAKRNYSTEFASQVSIYKSGKYTVERPLHLGAALAGKLAVLSEGLSLYGLPLGEAFQLRDDIIGAFGDESITGKPVGDDLNEGKPTQLFTIAYDSAGDSQRRALERDFGRQNLTDEEIMRLQEIIVETGALARVELLIDSLVEKSVAALEPMDIAAEAQEELTALAYFVGRRVN